MDLSKFQRINLDGLFVEYDLEEFLERIKKTDERETGGCKMETIAWRLKKEYNGNIGLYRRW